jgi:hypothetical protein
LSVPIDFFLVGAAKSGTTALARYFSRRPDVFIPPRKEPQFLVWGDSSAGELTPEVFWAWSAQRRALSPLNSLLFVERIASYRALFEPAPVESVLGDASPQYLYAPGVARRIGDGFPNARVVVLLRSPVERAFSHYERNFELGAETEWSFARATESEDPRARPLIEGERHYLRMGFYGAQLSEFVDRLGRERIWIERYEDLTRESHAVVERICRFLEIPPSNAPLGRDNETRSPRSRWLHRTLATPARWKVELKRALPSSLVNQLVRAASELRGRNMSNRRHRLSRRDFERCAGFFRDDLVQLSDVLHRDFRDWGRWR